MRSDRFIHASEDDTAYLSISLKRNQQNRLDFCPEKYLPARSEKSLPQNKMVAIFVVVLALIGFGFVIFTGPKNEMGMPIIQEKMDQTVQNVYEQIPIRNPSIEILSESPRSTASLIKGAHSHAQTAQSKVSRKKRSYRLPKTSQQFSGTVITNK